MKLFKIRGENRHGCGFCHVDHKLLFLAHHMKIHREGEKIANFIKLKIVLVKSLIQKVKSQARNEEKIFAKYTCDKELVLHNIKCYETSSYVKNGYQGSLFN